jgi:hypothetical protein
MPDYGIKVYNTSGELIIDNLNSNYNYYSTVSASGTLAYIVVNVPVATPTGIAPLLLVSGSGSAGIVWTAFSNGVATAYTLRVSGSVNLAWVYPSDTTQTINDNYGLVIRTQNDKIIFDSRCRNVLLRDVIPFSTTYGTGLTLNHASVATPWYCLQAIQNTCVTGTTTRIDNITLAATTVSPTSCGVSFLTSGGYYNPAVAVNGTLLVCEITN